MTKSHMEEKEVYLAYASQNNLSPKEGKAGVKDRTLEAGTEAWKII